MFKIKDGREHFYQWDLDRQLIVSDPSITEVHFCNRTDNCSLVVETFVEDGLTLANVPNILLQSNWRVRVYAVDGAYTKHEACYEVKARTKPSDYIYTETEAYAVEDVVDKMLNDKKDDYVKELEEAAIGDIEAALDEIIALQNQYIGGDVI